MSDDRFRSNLWLADNIGGEQRFAKMGAVDLMLEGMPVRKAPDSDSTTQKLMMTTGGGHITFKDGRQASWSMSMGGSSMSVSVGGSKTDDYVHAIVDLEEVIAAAALELLSIQEELVEARDAWEGE